MTTPKKRVKKPALERNRPVRSFAKLVRAPQKRATRGFIERSVDLGYTLIDEYVLAGRKAAERIRGAGDAQTATATATSPRVAEYATDLVQAGLELVQALAMPAEQRPPTGTAAPFATPRPRPARNYRLTVDTSRRVQVALDLTPDAATGTLRAQNVRRQQRRDPESERAVTLSIDERERTFRVRIQAKIAEGTYRSLLVDAVENLPRGTLEIKVLPKAGRR